MTDWVFFHSFAWIFSSCGEWELLFVALCELLIVITSPVVEHRL